jgi:hypothetical protein
MTQGMAVTPENFDQKLQQTLQGLYGKFGGQNDMLTPLTGQYYSEAGLQPGYTPTAAGRNTFRSGVAGYTPNLPTMFQFGAPPVDASFQQYRPGAFQPAGVTTGGFITGYNNDGTPIYSSYANPSMSVSQAREAGNTSPATIQDYINQQVQEQIAAAEAARVAALATANVNRPDSSSG